MSPLLTSCQLPASFTPLVPAFLVQTRGLLSIPRLHTPDLSRHDLLAIMGLPLGSQVQNKVCLPQRNEWDEARVCLAKDSGVSHGAGALEPSFHCIMDLYLDDPQSSQVPQT